MFADPQTIVDGRAPGGRPAKTAPTTRICAVGGDPYPRAQLIRFVADPNDLVVPDIVGSLPGRGVWIRAERAAINRGVRRNVFARALQRPVRAPKDLAETAERLLADRLIELIGLARRAGDAVAGFEKCRALLASLDRTSRRSVAKNESVERRSAAENEGVERRSAAKNESVERRSAAKNESVERRQMAVFVASDAAPASLAKFFSILDRLPAAIPMHRADPLTAEMLGRPFNRERVAQMVIRPGGLAAKLILEAQRLTDLRDGTPTLDATLDDGHE